jgi:alcohol dehydrogenase
MKYRALVVREAVEGSSEKGDGEGNPSTTLQGAPQFTHSVEECDTEKLPEGELLVRVLYSSLNYKDALSASGNKGVTKRYPHTPGIDAAGTVAESRSQEFREGDEVIITGFDLGMNTPGGFGEYIRVPSAWAVKRPATLTLRDSMVYGTAGFTAAIAVRLLEWAGAKSESGRAVVTGAKGGVGGFALAMLSRIGFEVDAVTGNPQSAEYLKLLGTSAVVDRGELEQDEARPLLHSRWIAAVDTAGGRILSNLLKSIEYGGAVAACGNVASGSFEGSVYPFILRGIRLLGVESSNFPVEARASLWGELAGRLNVLGSGIAVKECRLTELPERVAEILSGKLAGRVVVDLTK